MAVPESFGARLGRAFAELAALPRGGRTIDERLAVGLDHALGFAHNPAARIAGQPNGRRHTDIEIQPLFTRGTEVRRAVRAKPDSPPPMSKILDPLDAKRIDIATASMLRVLRAVDERSFTIARGSVDPWTDREIPRLPTSWSVDALQKDIATMKRYARDVCTLDAADTLDRIAFNALMARAAISTLDELQARWGSETREQRMQRMNLLQQIETLHDELGLAMFGRQGTDESQLTGEQRARVAIAAFRITHGERALLRVRMGLDFNHPALTLHADYMRVCVHAGLNHEGRLVPGWKPPEHSPLNQLAGKDVEHLMELPRKAEKALQRQYRRCHKAQRNADRVRLFDGKVFRSKTEAPAFIGNVDEFADMSFRDAIRMLNELSANVRTTLQRTQHLLASGETSDRDTQRRARCLVDIRDLIEGSNFSHALARFEANLSRLRAVAGDIVLQAEVAPEQCAGETLLLARRLLQRPQDADMARVLHRMTQAADRIREPSGPGATWHGVVALVDVFVDATRVVAQELTSADRLARELAGRPLTAEPLRLGLS
jgi:hypothetical protein